ncbi:hypothetical protein ACIOGZ_29365 [Kitasatospora sp. NPDC088160]|uniref:hypothetical protein n=1 Tax=Kitasatospora sp. NPDC088160 TaxID=3364072 RepID=UPI0038147351
MILHASRVWRLGDGTPRLCAVGFSARLSGVLVVPVLLWAVVAEGPIGWERAALVTALLRTAKDIEVCGFVTGRH